MKKYVSLGSAMMLGVVLGKEKSSYGFNNASKHSAAALEAPKHAHYLASTAAPAKKLAAPAPILKASHYSHSVVSKKSLDRVSYITSNIDTTPFGHQTINSLHSSHKSLVDLDKSYHTDR
jgi:hypothetical protein